MKKITFILLSAWIALFSAKSHANLQLGLGVDQGIGISAQINNIQLFAGDDGISLDYIFKQGRFEQQNPLTWYIAGGAFIGEHDFGIRMPVGLKLYFARGWHLYAQLSPQLESHDDNHGNDDSLSFGLGSALGVRYTF